MHPTLDFNTVTSKMSVEAEGNDGGCFSVSTSCCCNSGLKGVLISSPKAVAG